MKAYRLIPTAEYKARNLKVRKLRASGWSYERIGKEVGLTRQRVAQICKT